MFFILLQDIFIESEIVAQGSLNGVFSGKHYNRCIRAHKLVFEALNDFVLKLSLTAKHLFKKEKLST